MYIRDLSRVFVTIKDANTIYSFACAYLYVSDNYLRIYNNQNKMLDQFNMKYVVRFSPVYGPQDAV